MPVRGLKRHVSMTLISKLWPNNVSSAKNFELISVSPLLDSPGVMSISIYPTSCPFISKP